MIFEFNINIILNTIQVKNGLESFLVFKMLTLRMFKNELESFLVFKMLTLRMFSDAVSQLL